MPVFDADEPAGAVIEPAQAASSTVAAASDEEARTMERVEKRVIGVPWGEFGTWRAAAPWRGCDAARLVETPTPFKRRCPVVPARRVEQALRRHAMLSHAVAPNPPRRARRSGRRRACFSS